VYPSSLSLGGTGYEISVLKATYPVAMIIFLNLGCSSFQTRGADRPTRKLGGTERAIYAVQELTRYSRFTELQHEGPAAISFS